MPVDPAIWSRHLYRHLRGVSGSPWLVTGALLGYDSQMSGKHCQLSPVCVGGGGGQVQNNSQWSEDGVEGGLLFFLTTVSLCIPSCPESHYVAQAALAIVASPCLPHVGTTDRQACAVMPHYFFFFCGAHSAPPLSHIPLQGTSDSFHIAPCTWGSDFLFRLKLGSRGESEKHLIGAQAGE